MTHTISLATSALLCDVLISCWSAKKIAKKESEELTDSKTASRRSAQVHKNLLSDDVRLIAINKYAAGIRNWISTATVPWSDNGTRLVSTRQFLDFKQELDIRKNEFDRMVAEFVTMYPTLISAQAFKLGTMFNRDEYPDPQEVATKFGIRYTFTPIPEVGDFRVDIADDIAAELKAQYAQSYKSSVESMQRDLWGRLKDVLDKMQDRLAPDADGKPKVFRNTLISNARDVCELLKVVNVMNDPELEAARREVEMMISGVDGDILRETDGLRTVIKNKAEDILDRFSF